MGRIKLSNAERQRIYRERRNADPERRHAYLERKHRKYQMDKFVGKRAPITSMTGRAQRRQRQTWRTQKADSRKRLRSLNNLLLPPSSPHGPIMEPLRSRLVSSGMESITIKSEPNDYDEQCPEFVDENTGKGETMMQTWSTKEEHPEDPIHCGNSEPFPVRLYRVDRTTALGSDRGSNVRCVKIEISEQPHSVSSYITKTKHLDNVKRDQRTNTMQAFKEHIRHHTVEKPYKCTICPYSCARIDCLKRHERTHTGEQPYKCSICGYSYARKDSLKRHERIHWGKKRHKMLTEKIQLFREATPI